MGAKIHEYANEAFQINDEDFYDVDYWNGASYETRKISGATLKAELSGGGGGLDVGTTAVTNGTDGRVFFQAAGVLQQDAAFFWDNTNKRLGVGSSPASNVRLDVRAQGALSTDIAFRVRNSADSADIFSVRGNNDIYLPPTVFNSSASIYLSGTTDTLIRYQTAGQSGVAIGHNSVFNTSTSYNTIVGGSSTTSATTGMGVIVGWGNTISAQSYGIILGSQTRVNGLHTIRIGHDGGASSYGGTNSIHLGKTVSGNNITIDNVFMTYFNSQSSSTLTRSNGSFGLLGQQAYILGNGTGTFGVETFMGNGGNTLVVSNHTSVPSTNITNSFQLYSNDITAGNASPHFRTENGNIIKLYQQSSAGITTVADLVTVLQNLGLLS